MKERSRFPELGCLVLVILGIGVVVWFLSNAVPHMRYNRRTERINEKIHSLLPRRPADVSERQWAECVGWASIAHCNICSSEEHTSYEAMCRFEEQLDDKLQGEVDLDTIAWICERLAETGPHGRHYISMWREHWDILKPPGQDSQP